MDNQNVTMGRLQQTASRNINNLLGLNDRLLGLLGELSPGADKELVAAQNAPPSAPPNGVLQVLDDTLYREGAQLELAGNTVDRIRSLLLDGIPERAGPPGGGQAHVVGLTALGRGLR